MVQLGKDCEVARYSCRTTWFKLGQVTFFFFFPSSPKISIENIEMILRSSLILMLFVHLFDCVFFQVLDPSRCDSQILQHRAPRHVSDRFCVSEVTWVMWHPWSFWLPWTSWHLWYFISKAQKTSKDMK